MLIFSPPRTRSGSRQIPVRQCQEPWITTGAGFLHHLVEVQQASKLQLPPLGLHRKDCSLPSPGRPPQAAAKRSASLGSVIGCVFKCLHVVAAASTELPTPPSPWAQGLTAAWVTAITPVKGKLGAITPSIYTWQLLCSLPGGCCMSKSPAWSKCNLWWGAPWTAAWLICPGQEQVPQPAPESHMGHGHLGLVISTTGLFTVIHWRQGLSQRSCACPPVEATDVKCRHIRCFPSAMAIVGRLLLQIAQHVSPRLHLQLQSFPRTIFPQMETRDLLQLRWHRGKDSQPWLATRHGKEALQPGPDSA